MAAGGLIRMLRDHILNNKQEAKRVNSKWGKTKLSEPASSDRFPLPLQSSITSLNTVPIPRDQVSSYMNLGGAFLCQTTTASQILYMHACLYMCVYNYISPFSCWLFSPQIAPPAFVPHVLYNLASLLRSFSLFSWSLFYFHDLDRHKFKSGSHTWINTFDIWCLLLSPSIDGTGQFHPFSYRTWLHFCTCILFIHLLMDIWIGSIF